MKLVQEDEHVLLLWKYIVEALCKKNMEGSPYVIFFIIILM